MNSQSRREFIKKSAMAAAVAAPTITMSQAASRRKRRKYMGGFKAKKLSKVKIAIIGCGERSGTHLRHLSYLKGTEFVGICDYVEGKAKGAKGIVLSQDAERHKNVKLFYGSEKAYVDMIRETKPDVVYIITPWKWHAPMAIDAMENGAHAMVEVPLATTIEDLWKIVKTSESTRKHCMMLENVNYGRDELLFLNMCRQGLLGEIIHAEAAYIHELRFQMFKDTPHSGTGSWRTYEYAENNGNLYPTHGLGPVAQCMNLVRGGDNFSKIVSMSTPARGRALYAKKHFSSNHKWNKLDFKGGDLNTSIIQTLYGRTIMIQWDETSPRPYTRHNLLQGTEGIAVGFPEAMVALEKERGSIDDELFFLLARNKNDRTTNFHHWSKLRHTKAGRYIYDKYDHPLYKKMASEASRLGGHGGMDFIMNYRIIQSLLEGSPLDQNVYEGAFWSAVTPLSIKSVAEGGRPIKFPDFTRGRWKKTKPLGIVTG